MSACSSFATSFCARGHRGEARRRAAFVHRGAVDSVCSRLFNLSNT
ncbi:MAG: hypothetical protein MZU79_08790 [Anaerotruncus sp.]|nr:hypothetical protein [Anaerotruncus sp.]